MGKFLIKVFLKIFTRKLSSNCLNLGGKVMKKYILLIILLCGVIAASGCTGQNSGSGKVVNETKNVSGFNGVALNGTGNLIITQGTTESLTVEAEDNVITNIKTEVNNNQLNINSEQKMLVPTKPINYYLTVKNISSIDISGAGKIESTNLNTDTLNIKIKGAAGGNITSLTANKLTIKIDGAGKMDMAGNVNEQTINITGAGEYAAKDLTSKTVTLSVDGAGKATIRVSDQLNAIINGAGAIYYIGNPLLTKQITGAGSIKQISG
jgi:hypothetical protein